MKYYAVIDTNILISALIKENSVPARIIDFIKGETIIPLIHADILAEYRRVLHYDKFSFSQKQIDDIEEIFIHYGISIPPIRTDEFMPDLSDAIFFEVALGAQKFTDSAYLVTGNSKHFPVKPFVVTPREMLEILEKNS